MKLQLSNFIKTEKTGEANNNKKEFGMVAWMNKYSLGLQFLLSCFLCFLIECFSRHSLTEGVVFVADKTTVYLYNSLIIFATFLVVYLFKKRLQMRITLSAIWLFLGIINGCVLAARVTPFNYADIKLVGDLFAMKSNYFTVGQAILVIIGVSALVLFVLYLRLIYLFCQSIL